MVTPTSFLNNLSSVARNESIQTSSIRNSFGLTAEEIKTVFEKFLNESSLPSEQMEKFKLYLLDSLNLFDSFNRFDGNETVQTTLTAWNIQQYMDIPLLYFVSFYIYIVFCSSIPAYSFSFKSRYMRDKPQSHQKFVYYSLATMNIILLLLCLDVPGLEPVTLYNHVATINTPQIQFNGSFPEKFSYDTKVEVVMDDKNVVITDYCDYSDCTGNECDCYITVDYTEQEQHAQAGASAPGPRVPGITYVKFAMNAAKSVVQYFGFMRS